MVKRILHIHQDYPDGRAYPVTKAVSNLIEATEETTKDYEHFVLSINRTSNPLKISFKKFDRGVSVVYWALPLPFIYYPVMWMWSLIFYFILKKQRFYLVHAHKLTTEGIIGRCLSKRMKVPYIVSVRGGSDAHNIERLPCCRTIFKKISDEALHVFLVSPWMNKNYSDYFDKQKISFFPNICGFNKKLFCSSKSNGDTYVSILSYLQYKRKGVIPLIKSIGVLKKNGINIKLDIYGGGDDSVRRKLLECISNNDLDDFISLKGHVPREDAIKALMNSKGLLLPSCNETFGMVYIEALFSGVPVLYHKNTGIDGYFKSSNIGVSVDSQDVENISTSLIELERNHRDYMERIEDLKLSGDLDLFETKEIVNNYLSVINRS